MSALWSLDGFQPFTDRSVLDGHHVWLIVDYESRSVASGCVSSSTSLHASRPGGPSTASASAGAVAFSPVRAVALLAFESMERTIRPIGRREFA